MPIHRTNTKTLLPNLCNPQDSDSCSCFFLEQSEKEKRKIMYRSSSSTRVSDEFFSNPSSVSLSSPNPKPTITDSDHVLPTLHPQSHAAKKEKYRLRSAENAVHLIPVLLLFCAIVLWSFSSPVDLVNKSDSIVARVGTSTIIDHVDKGHAKSSLKSNMKQTSMDSEYQSTDSVDQKSDR